MLLLSPDPRRPCFLLWLESNSVFRTSPDAPCFTKLPLTHPPSHLLYHQAFISLSPCSSQAQPQEPQPYPHFLLQSSGQDRGKSAGWAVGSRILGSHPGLHCEGCPGLAALRLWLGMAGCPGLLGGVHSTLSILGPQGCTPTPPRLRATLQGYSSTVSEQHSDPPVLFGNWR